MATSIIIEELKEYRYGNLKFKIDENNQLYWTQGGLLYFAYFTPDNRFYWVDWEGEKHYLN